MMYFLGFSKKLGCTILHSEAASLKLFAMLKVFNCCLGWSEKSLCIKRNHFQISDFSFRSQCHWLGLGIDHLFCQAQVSLRIYIKYNKIVTNMKSLCLL